MYHSNSFFLVTWIRVSSQITLRNFYDVLTTYGYIFVIFLLINILSNVSNGYFFADYPPTPTDLRNLWMAPKLKVRQSKGSESEKAMVYITLHI